MTDTSHHALVKELLALGQEHLFAGWSPPGEDEETKQAFLGELARIQTAYPGGLEAYVQNARRLLAEARNGANPYEGFVPEQPDTVDLTKFDEVYDHYEALGRAHFDKTAVVLVAGGLGERLGYNGIKLDIPVEVTGDTTYLAHYAACLKAMEARMPNPRPVPFIIMVSKDTQAPTQAALEEHAFYGLRPEQVHLVQQELVPAIADNEARLALDDTYKLILKPHGHGDVHLLLHTSGLAHRLHEEGIEHFLFVQDTNGQVFNAVPAALGVSVEKDFAFNSLAVNRIPGEACGALTKLVGDGRELTVNVEYNQLDPLLRATVNPEGDVPNAQGHSLFPGNINVLVIQAKAYVRILRETQGIIAEFVNPKYADETKTAFKKPTRLETMMQDLAKLLRPEDRVGVSIFDRRWCFSANKNNIRDAAEKEASGGPPESGASAESDFYLAGRMKLEAAGMRVETAAPRAIRGVTVTPGPRVILRPSFALTLAEVRAAVQGGSISGEATLVLDGPDIRLQNVRIEDGAALVVEAVAGAQVQVKDVRIDNEGYACVLLTDEEMKDLDTPEYLRIRGYRIEPRAPRIEKFPESGAYTLS
jgi:UDP-sugar pyrophosphorylase